MLDEIVSYLDPKPKEVIVDCTLGGAGYTSAIAGLVGKEGRVLALDLDELAISNAERLFKEKGIENVTMEQCNFKKIDEAVSKKLGSNKQVDGIVFDLGLSSAQLDDEARGFSFKGQRPLDMAFGPDNTRSTSDIVNNYSVEELTGIFREYGEEKQAYKIAKRIAEERKSKRIETTDDLVSIIEKVIPLRPWSKIHPATKVFQALRIETNEELESLKIALEKSEKLLKKGGRLVVVSFHSGEDRIVKNFLKERKNESFRIVTKKPIVATEMESKKNSRSRSAKLRAAIKN